MDLEAVIGLEWTFEHSEEGFDLGENLRWNQKANGNGSCAGALVVTSIDGVVCMLF